MHNKDLTDYTPAERLWLWRRADHLTQIAAAARLGYGVKAYRAAEQGLRNGVTAPRRGKPTPGDLCALARRRAALGLVGTAQAVKVSKITLISWEIRGDARLIAFWEKKGFTFR